MRSEWLNLQRARAEAHGMRRITTHRGKVGRERPPERAVRRPQKRRRQARRVLTLIMKVTHGHEPVSALLAYLALYHEAAHAVKGLTRMLG
jgi:hypothetical protein